MALESATPPERLLLRACQCSFCLKHGAISTADPEGHVEIGVRDADVERYRFGLRTSDFLVCRRCGVYVAAVMTAGGKTYATINANALEPRKAFAREATPMSYDGETPEQRIARRIAKWTPATVTSLPSP